MNNMDNMYENLKKIQSQLEVSKEKLKEIKVEGNAGAGMLKVQMNGNFEILDLEIDPSLMNPSEINVLKNLLKGALNDAHEKIKEKSGQYLSSDLPFDKFKNMFNG